MTLVSMQKQHVFLITRWGTCALASIDFGIIFSGSAISNSGSPIFFDSHKVEY